MEDQDTSSLTLTIQPEFGTIYRSGEFVQRGSILGMTADARKVVIAPIGGWVSVLPKVDGTEGLTVEIHPRPQSALDCPAHRVLKTPGKTVQASCGRETHQ